MTIIFDMPALRTKKLTIYTKKTLQNYEMKECRKQAANDQRVNTDENLKITLTKLPNQITEYIQEFT